MTFLLHRSSVYNVPGLVSEPVMLYLVYVSDLAWCEVAVLLSHRRLVAWRSQHQDDLGQETQMHLTQD